MAELILEESDIEEYAEFFRSISKQAEDNYQALLKDTKYNSDNVFIEGVTAEELKAYKVQISLLDGMLQKYGESCANLLEAFLSEIKNIDNAYGG